MAEEFTEENIEGQIINGDEEHEGINWGKSIAKVFTPPKSFFTQPTSVFAPIKSIFAPPPAVVAAVKPASDCSAIQRTADDYKRTIERLQQESNSKEQRIREAYKRIQTLENQVRQLQARVWQLERTIREKNILLGKKTKHIAFLTRENTRLRKKVNSILDNLQYYRTLVLGNDTVDGYKTTVVKQQIENETLKHQEVGNPIGTDNQEGYINQSSATYNAVFSQNNAIKNQVELNTNEYSIDNQLSSNISAKINIMKNINVGLIVIFLCVFVYGCYRIYMKTEMNNIVKMVTVISMFLVIIVLHTIEYVILYSYPYFSSLLVGTPYNPPDYWKIPGIHDYLSTV